MVGGDVRRTARALWLGNTFGFMSASGDALGNNASRSCCFLAQFVFCSLYRRAKLPLG